MICPGSKFPWEDYLDHRFDDKRSRELKAHLQTCALCRGRLQEAETLRDTLSRIPRRIVPNRDLWPDIEKRIRFDADAEKTPRISRVNRLVPLAAAALFLMGVLAASLVQTISPTSRRRPLVQLISGSEGSQSVMRRFSEIDRKYQRVRDSFLAAMEARGDVVDPHFAEIVENQLRTIDQAVTELMMALEEHPENRELWSLMAQANENRMDILQTAQTHLY